MGQFEKRIKPEILWLGFRTTCAKILARNGVDVFQTLIQLGRANMRITEKFYAHFHPEYMGQANDHSSQMLQIF